MDLLEPKPFPALDSLLAQVFWAAVSLPHAWAGAPQSALRGDEHAVIRIENLTDELLGNFWTVGIGGIDEIDPKLDKAFRVWIASAMSTGGPQTRGPVMRIAPKPRR